MISQHLTIVVSGGIVMSIKSAGFNIAHNIRQALLDVGNCHIDAVKSNDVLSADTTAIEGARIARLGKSKQILQWAVALQQELTRPIDTNTLKNIATNADKAATPKELQASFYLALGALEIKYADTIIPELKRAFQKDTSQLGLSTKEFLAKNLMSNTCLNFTEWPGVKEVFSYTVPFSEPLESGISLTGSAINTAIGKGLDDYKLARTVVGDLNRKGTPVPAKDFWEVPQRREAIAEIRQTLSLISRLRENGLEVPEQFMPILQACDTLCKNIDAKSWSTLPATLTSVSAELIGQGLSYALMASAVEAPLLAMLCIPLSVLIKTTSATVAGALGESVKMGQIANYNFKHADLLTSAGEVDIQKARQLYFFAPQIKEKYVQAALLHEIAHTLYSLEKTEEDIDHLQHMPPPSDLAFEKHMRLHELQQEINNTQYLIDELKPQVDKKNYRDVKILIDLRNQGMDAYLLKDIVPFLAQSVRCEYQKWQSEHAQSPTPYTQDIQSLYQLLPEECRHAQYNELEQALGVQEKNNLFSLTGMPHGKLLQLETKLKKLQDQQSELSCQSYLKPDPLRSVASGLQNLPFSIKRSVQREKEIDPYNKLLGYQVLKKRYDQKLKSALTDYSAFQKLTEAIRENKHSDELQKIVGALPDGFLKTILCDSEKLVEVGIKCLKAVPDLIFGGFNSEQLHLQTQGLAMHHKNNHMGKLKSHASEDACLPSAQSIKPFIDFYKSESLGFYDKTDRAINRANKRFVNSVPFDITHKKNVGRLLKKERSLEHVRSGG
ncbi:MAG: hypothetical protein IT497_06045 [Ottowia sp.]|nr:hypothetical protein [Ottowia sp.]